MQIANSTNLSSGPGPHLNGIGAVICTYSCNAFTIHDLNCRHAAAAAAAMAAAAAAAGSHRRLHLYSSHMLITSVLLCRPYRRLWTHGKPQTPLFWTGKAYFHPGTSGCCTFWEFDPCAVSAVREARGVVPPFLARVCSSRADSERLVTARDGPKGAFPGTCAPSAGGPFATKSRVAVSGVRGELAPR